MGLAGTEELLQHPGGHCQQAGLSAEIDSCKVTTKSSHNDRAQYGHKSLNHVVGQGWTVMKSSLAYHRSQMLIYCLQQTRFGH